MNDEPIYTAAECDRWIWRFFFNGFWLGASLAGVAFFMWKRQ